MVKAVQYVRMSTDLQDCSIPFQVKRNEEYAHSQGYELIRTYADEGISGVGIDRREALRTLIAEAVTEPHDFSVVLVYDVSRWGRFQNPDEAAYYEFLCWRAGVRVEYTAEPSLNDGTLTATLVKSVKRVMAAEYSRELSLRQIASRRFLISRGYWPSGSTPYGYQRQLVDQQGRLGELVAPGGRASIRGFHFLLRPGPQHEVETVRRIFRLHNRGATSRSICSRFNEEGLSYRGGGAWTRPTVASILKNEIYAGTMVFGRDVRIFGSKARSPNSTPQRIEGYVEPVISRTVFDRATRERRLRRQAASDAALLSKLKALLEREGKLTGGLIKRDPDCPGLHAYRRAFGGLINAYTLIGYDPPHRQRQLADGGWGRRRAWSAPVHYSDEEMILNLRRVLMLHGRLSVELIEATPDISCSATYRLRFGGLRRAYALAGYQPTKKQDSNFDAVPKAQSITRAQAALLKAEVEWGRQPLNLRLYERPHPDSPDREESADFRATW